MDLEGPRLEDDLAGGKPVIGGQGKNLSRASRGGKPPPGSSPGGSPKGAVGIVEVDERHSLTVRSRQRRLPGAARSCTWIAS